MTIIVIPRSYSKSLRSINRRWISINSYKHWFLYMLRCNDGSIYSGITVNIDKRMSNHQMGKGSKYVRSRLPVSLAVWWKFATSRRDIQKLEQRVKRLTKKRKMELIDKPLLISNYCEDLGENIKLLLCEKQQ